MAMRSMLLWSWYERLLTDSENKPADSEPHTGGSSGWSIASLVSKTQTRTDMDAKQRFSELAEGLARAVGEIEVVADKLDKATARIIGLEEGVDDHERRMDEADAAMSEVRERLNRLNGST